MFPVRESTECAVARLRRSRGDAPLTSLLTFDIFRPVENSYNRSHLFERSRLLIEHAKAVADIARAIRDSSSSCRTARATVRRLSKRHTLGLLKTLDTGYDLEMLKARIETFAQQRLARTRE